MIETLKTGIPAVDRYLAKGYEEVRGFSSRYSATICGHLLRRQSELAEIGIFEGRFFITLALAVGEGERRAEISVVSCRGHQTLRDRSDGELQRTALDHWRRCDGARLRRPHIRPGSCRRADDIDLTDAAALHQASMIPESISRR